MSHRPRTLPSTRTVIGSLLTLILIMTGAAAAAPRAAAAEPQPYKLRVLEHNIAGGMNFKGGPEALNGINTQITAFNPDVVILTEVCASQRDRFAADHPDWDLHWTAMVEESSGCRTSDNPSSAQGQVVASPHPMSNLQSIPLGQTDQQIDDDGTVIREKVFTMICADVAISGHSATTLRACGVHLIAFQEPVEGWIPTDRIGARTKQVATMAKTLNAWVADGVAVTVGGDFNTRPWHATLNPLYHLSTAGKFEGSGQFHEADQTDGKWFDTRPSGVTCREDKQCRTGQFTINGTRKYDYVFISRNVTHGGEVSALSADKYGSDHNLYRALFNIKL
ncbi:endonuclease/exonuclease/phosphatase family protein [Propionibacteriaceae bacterium Y1685]|uniref:endonuclease/exonuclease/phosphatase family protein n=1 Tax=Microlunatus sp. Y1700 TaxID=3418487 RepID=UPI003B7B809C